MKELSEVFNEANVPTITYVTPKEARHIKASLTTKGKHVTLVGASGCGKSTVAEKILEELKLTDGQVHKFSGRSYPDATSILEVLGQEFQVEPTRDAIDEWLTLYKVVMVDDVHHLTSGAREELAGFLKLWHEKGIKFFLIGIAKTSDQIVGTDPELAIRNDVHTLGVQGDEFLREVLRLGEDALNIKFSSNFSDSAIAAAKGLPAIFQAICRIACVEAGVEKTCPETVNVDVELRHIGRSVVKMFDPRYFLRLVGLAQGRRQARAVHDTFYSIVEVFARSEKSQISKAELYRKIVGPIDDPGLKKRKSTSFYRAMGTLQRAIEERGLADILLYESDTLSIDDPVFRFYLDHVDFSRVQPLVKIRKDGYDWDVAVSFAGEDRALVQMLVKELEDHGVEVFYDFNESARLWGKDLEDELARIYSEEARFMVLCLSEHYSIKDWTRFELQIGKAAAKKRTSEYLLPLFLPGRKPELVGLKDTVGYQTLNSERVKDVAALIIEKLSHTDE